MDTVKEDLETIQASDAAAYERICAMIHEAAKAALKKVPLPNLDSMSQERVLMFCAGLGLTEQQARMSVRMGQHPREYANYLRKKGLLK